MFRIIAENFHWTPETIGKLTLYEARFYAYSDPDKLGPKIEKGLTLDDMKKRLKSKRGAKAKGKRYGR